MIKVIPAILTNSQQVALEHLSEVEGIVDQVSIDILDGNFAENKTIDPLSLVEVNTNLNLDFQLMVFEPINWVDKCIMAHAKRIIGHVEYMADQKAFITKVKESGAGVGLAVDLPTSLSKISNEVLRHIDCLLIMSVNAGYSAQGFEDLAYKKITEAIQVRTMFNYPFTIQVDGGVNKEIAKRLDEMGVDEVSMTSHIFQGNPSYNINEINSYLSQG